MPIVYEVTAAGEKYTAKDGSEKTKWIKIGTVIQTKAGKMSLKIESIPVGWDGWASLMAPRQDDAPKKSRQPGDDDDLPF
jgi:hypothetical protein